MKRVALSTLSLAMLAAAGTAHAQSSVTLYGLIDESVQYFNNVATGKNANGLPINNKSQIGLGGSNMQGTRWGLKGSEDLGNGLKAIFQLENGFNLNNGTSTKMFGRQAYVGLDSAQFGTLTLGRQYDTTTDLVQGLTADGYFGSMFATPGDVDNNDNSARFNNVVKYTSTVMSGFQFAGMYALGGVAGQTGAGQTWGAAATYGIGSFNVAAGYLKQDNGVAPTTGDRTWNSTTSDGVIDGQVNVNGFYNATAKSIGIAQVAAQYVAGPFTLAARYSNAQYKPDAFSGFGSTQRYNVAGAFVGYQLNPATLLGLGYAWTHGSGDSSNTYNQISIGADYHISKRTDFYALAAYQRASGQQPGQPAGTRAQASIGSYGVDSASNSQTLVNVGIRHKF